MHSVQYGNTTIEYAIEVKEGLKSHYITVDQENGVVLKGKPLPIETADQFVRKKARWILEKLELVRSVGEEDIVTGSRIPYLGRKYYVEVIFRDDLKSATVEFTHSRFRIYLHPESEIQPTLKEAIRYFYKQKAIEKIAPRVKKWAKVTGLSYNELKFLKMEKRWGSCTPLNNIIINTDAIKLPFTLIDYLIVHELVHTKVKDHSKEFWSELSRHLPNWKELDGRMGELRL